MDNLAKLKQDIIEVKGKLEDLEENTDHDFRKIKVLLQALHDVIDILDEDFKNHIETVENFICDVR
ncbi:hypothetical protein [uncultured Clostridium sp.]|uniref:hypothetical protein n=1 Tax=uncultured Clostridium sp. TaxID=59620 RepID=UPI0028F0096A|nr:hypothetical protein [uncultured Clostridium sp.]